VCRPTQIVADGARHQDFRIDGRQSGAHDGQDVQAKRVERFRQ
jgi:hypothetical protein